MPVLISEPKLASHPTSKIHVLRLHCKNQGCLAAILVLALCVEIVVVVGSLLDERFQIPELAMVLGERTSESHTLDSTIGVG